MGLEQPAQGGFRCFRGIAAGRGPPTLLITSGRTSDACILALVRCCWHDTFSSSGVHGSSAGRQNRARKTSRMTRSSATSGMAISQEWNNPAPKWWLYLYFITIIWAVGYLVAFGPGQLGGNTGLVAARSVRSRDAGRRSPLRADLRELRGHGLRRAVEERRRKQARQEPVCELLHDLPWLGCPRCNGLSRT